jgi:hypothetical protein
MLVVVTAFSLLGRWQWDVSESQRGGLQNLLYAFQWWFMAGMVIYGWWRLLHDDVHGKRHADPVVAAPAGPSLVTADDAAWPEMGRRVSSAELIDVQLATAVDDEADEELARYNEYLASLNRRSESTR